VSTAAARKHVLLSRACDNLLHLLHRLCPAATPWVALSPTSHLSHICPHPLQDQVRHPTWRRWQGAAAQGRWHLDAGGARAEAVGRLERKGLKGHTCPVSHAMQQQQHLAAGSCHPVRSLCLGSCAVLTTV
jgi:hypothetical protein